MISQPKNKQHERTVKFNPTPAEWRRLIQFGKDRGWIKTPPQISTACAMSRVRREKYRTKTKVEEAKEVLLA